MSREGRTALAAVKIADIVNKKHPEIPKNQVMRTVEAMDKQELLDIHPKATKGK